MKQQRFVEEYVKNGGNATQAVIDAKYKVKNRVVAQAIGHENLLKPLIAKAVKSIADQISDKKLLKVHNEGLDAEHKIFKNNNETGEIEYVDTEPDFNVRHKYLESAYKLKKLYTEGSVTDNRQINITIYRSDSRNSNK